MEHIKKKILLLSTTDDNGAHEAIYRLAKHFNSLGNKTVFLVKNKTKKDRLIRQYYQPIYNKKNIFSKISYKLALLFPVKKAKKKINLDPLYEFISLDEVSINTNPQRIVDLIGFIPDFIYTGITNDFMNSTDLLNLQQLTKAKVYNITVDMSHFTGGCHYAWDCKGYINGCDTNCPAILSSDHQEIAKRNFEMKLQNATTGQFNIIAGSGWTLKQAKESKIYKHQSEFFNVNSLIDTTVFNPKNRVFAKKTFNLEEDKFYILMGCQHANAKRKGFEYLLEALKELYVLLDENQRKKIKVLIVARNEADNFSEIPFDKQHIDYVNDYRLLSLLYQASDVFVNSSIEDAGPMMVSEALACGTPVVGFDMGVVDNMVINDYNGYKAILKDSVDLANGIYTVLKLNTVEYNAYSRNAVRQVEEFSSMRYVKEVFDKIMKD